MAINTGVTFGPQGGDLDTQRSTRAALAPSSRPLEVLSLQLPKVLGSRAIAPRSLLAPQGGTGAGVSPESAVLQSVLRSFGPRALSTISDSPAAAPSAPTAAPVDLGLPTVRGASSGQADPSIDAMSVMEALRRLLASAPGGGAGGPAGPIFGGPVVRPGASPFPDVPTPAPGPAPSPGPSPFDGGGGQQPSFQDFMDLFGMRGA